MKTSTNETRVVTDPVCGMKLDPEKTDLTASYKECTYYFCADACREAFEKNPGDYIGRGPGKRKGLWGRYLDRLQKSTGGKAMQCH
ncbi:MAG: YHS domain-containing protein [Desulfobacterales bacterium]|jgi:YHS domain-containing protein